MAKPAKSNGGPHSGVKAAIEAARQYVRGVFEEENPTDLRLEEVELVEGKPVRWLITLSYHRNRTQGAAVAEALSRGADPSRHDLMSGPRAYKVVTVRDADLGVVRVHDVLIREPQLREPLRA